MRYSSCLQAGCELHVKAVVALVHVPVRYLPGGHVGKVQGMQKSPSRYWLALHFVLATHS